MTRQICIYHAHCLDGFTAAWVVWTILGNDAEFIPAAYGDAPPDVTGADVVIVDFSYPRETIIALAAQARSLIVLDHHATARAALEGLVLSNALIQFDMARSGAQMAWDHFRTGLRRPVLVDYVADRDLWRFALPDSRSINAYIGAYDRMHFSSWSRLEDELSFDLDHATVIGSALLAQHQDFCGRGLDMTLRYMVIGGERVPVANLPAFLASEAGNMLAEGNPFAAIYFDSATGRKFSLRSRQGGRDVSQVAAAYGGGGHPNAAGFTMPIGWEGDEVAA